MTHPIPIPRPRADRPRVLDLFCHRGGMAMGYHLAGFDVVGVDVDAECSTEYPFTFVHADAIDYLHAHGGEFDLIHASPPCQLYTPLNAYNHKAYPDLIAPTRQAMRAIGRPYVIENVEAARPELLDPVMLCGPMFGLRMYRHRLFETSFPLSAPVHPEHRALCTRNGYLPTEAKPFMTITGGRHSRAWQRAAAHAMGTPWITTIKGVCEAIPPGYAHWIGQQALARLDTKAVAA
ncbi:DNA cytosine methyltransferase [Streptomyces sp. ICBB 8177]|uniref:DNA cytosine methyltransferase n=1 Tax=Streptomyces sp. ICBB 8177 TaxID=563922 RepID=UPI000D673000|nr:DNA cytosine methyltransferase [Streptomyces sp. ICBB 8177]PWI41267.1 SAM-dependent methyltransferase [Streptomyces sp. ICBB 8177]